MGRRIVGPQRPPVVTVGAQGVGKAPRVQGIILGPTGGLAVAEPLGRLGIHRMDPQSHLQEPLDRRSPAGLDGHADPAQLLPRCHQFRELGAQHTPALGRVRKLQLQELLALAVHHRHIVLLAGPVEPREVREFREGHNLTRCVHQTPSFPGPAIPRRRPKPVARQPDTRPSQGCCSLKRRNRPRRTAR